MRLTEFYALDEGRRTFYTLEPESNGMGRLLAWEEVGYADAAMAEPEGETSYEVVARGNVERLIAALPPEFQEVAGEVERAWDEATEGGEAVWVGADERGPRVDVTAKVGKAQSGRDDADYDYEDGEERYF